MWSTNTWLYIYIYGIAIDEITNNNSNFQQNISKLKFSVYSDTFIKRNTRAFPFPCVFHQQWTIQLDKCVFSRRSSSYFSVGFSSWIFLGKYFPDVWVELLPTTGNFNSFFKVHERVWHHSNSRVKAVNKKRFFNLPFSPMRLKIQENSVLPINCVFFVLENVLCNTIGFLLTSNCIFVLVSSRGEKLLSLTKVALVTGIATKTINHILSFKLNQILNEKLKSVECIIDRLCAHIYNQKSEKK